jgi:hypothetical protein
MFATAIGFFWRDQMSQFGGLLCCAQATMTSFESVAGVVFGVDSAPFDGSPLSHGGGGGPHRAGAGLARASSAWDISGGAFGLSLDSRR